jgi:hypothetical protein
MMKCPIADAGEGFAMPSLGAPANGEKLRMHVVDNQEAGKGCTKLRQGEKS